MSDRDQISKAAWEIAVEMEIHASLGTKTAAKAEAIEAVLRRADLASPMSAAAEIDPASVAEPDGCPTEKAVLMRFWREHQTTSPLSAAAMKTAAVHLCEEGWPNEDGIVEYWPNGDAFGAQIAALPSPTPAQMLAEALGLEPIKALVELVEMYADEISMYRLIKASPDRRMIDLARAVNAPAKTALAALAALGAGE